MFLHHYGSIGGAGISLINTIKLLNGNYNIIVITPPGEISNILSDMVNVSVFKYDFIPSIPIYSGGISTLNPKMYFHLFKFFILKAKFIKFLSSFDFDILVVNSIITSWVGKFFNDIITICFVRETKSGTYFDYVQKKFLNEFDKVIFLSNYDNSSWALDTDTFVIHNYSNFVENTISKDSTSEFFDILYLGGGSYIKGFYDLIISLYICKNRDNINLHVLGVVNPIIINIFNLFFKKKLNVKFYGLVNDVNYFYNKCHVVIFPVKKVHQGRPIFEAGFNQKPIIVPDFKNFTEFVEDQVNGYYFKNNSVVSLASVIDYCADIKDDMTCTGLNNYNCSLSKHTKEIANLNISRLFDRL